MYKFAMTTLVVGLFATMGWWCWMDFSQARAAQQSVRVKADPDAALRGQPAGWAIRFEEREAARDNILPEREVVRFRDNESVKVLETRQHVVNEYGGWMNWSRVQSLDRADLPAAWIIDQALSGK